MGNRAQSHCRSSRWHAIKILMQISCSVEVYYAVGEVMVSDRFKSACRMNSAVVIFVASLEKVGGGKNSSFRLQVLEGHSFPACSEVR